MCYGFYLFLGADIDCCDKIGNTPLHIAARYGHDLLINTLLENGSDPTRYDRRLVFLFLFSLNCLTFNPFKPGIP